MVWYRYIIQGILGENNFGKQVPLILEKKYIFCI